jgi:dihydroorotate dehydrogenase (NAD+) catalytic subunit
MGGISTGRDALEFLAAGASAIALGTTLFSDPDAPGRVRGELASELADRGLAEPKDARGLAHREEPAVLPK